MATKLTRLIPATLALLTTTNATNATIAGYIDSQCNSEEQWSLQGTLGACISLAGQPEANSIVAQAPAGQEVILCSDSYCGNYTYTVAASETYCYDEASGAIGSVLITQAPSKVRRWQAFASWAAALL
ncbi:hypothetical protein PRZ48_000127 [Zasmidium cellare]|uniref:Uncharacterized protein n=1 Tax=Zasmidium cellare TaxID=395010 RepID=A0ABR0EXP3_ZASCE|nr:hypothetical protein PRZ48_000127 [Zasmidium cellare]